MGRFTLRSDAKLKEFGRLYIPEGTTWDECDPKRNPYDNIPIKEGTYLLEFHSLGRPV